MVGGDRVAGVVGGDRVAGRPAKVRGLALVLSFPGAFQSSRRMPPGGLAFKFNRQ